jgi:hypothetical protein
LKEVMVPAVDERDADGCCPERPDGPQTSETRADHDDVWFRLGRVVAAHRVLPRSACEIGHR